MEQAMSSIFEAVPELQRERAAWLERCARYQTRRAYYTGTVYTTRPDIVSKSKLYAGIRQIFGPLRRTVRIDVAKVPGAWALPAESPPALLAAVEALRRASGYRVAYRQALQYGAVAGDFGLLTIGGADGSPPQIIPYRPDYILTGVFDDGTPWGLVYQPAMRRGDTRYEYAMLLTPETARVYEDGRMLSEQRHPFGVVPVGVYPYRLAEDDTGDHAFAGAAELLDRVNEIASQTMDVVSRNAEPPLVISGVNEVDLTSDSNVIQLTAPDAKVYTVTPNLSVGESLQLIDKCLAEFKQVLPQLQWDSLTSRSDLAYETVITLLDEFVSYIQDVRSSVDPAIERHERMALMAMGAPVDGYALDPDRPVIPLGERQQLELEQLRRSMEQPGAAPADTEAAELAQRANAAGILIRSGFDAEDALRSVGLSPIKHLGLLPVTLQSESKAMAGANDSGSQVV
jgi:Phage portal protein, SPP1 Gp6-like